MNKIKRKCFTSIAAMRGMTIITILAVICFGFIGCGEREDETGTETETYVEQDGLRFYLIEGGEAYSVAGLPANKNNSSATSLEIPDHINNVPVITIRENAFNGFGYLENIVIPDSIATIGNYAFRDCKRLEYITIPDSVTFMGRNVFYGCSALETVEIGNGVTSIRNEAFYGCTKLEDITIGSSVTSIGDRAFYQCTNLEYITIPNSVTTIGNSAFRLCTSITTITIPGSVTTMGADVFKDCNSLHTIHVPFAQANIPAGWDEAWSGITDSGTITIQYSNGYTAVADGTPDTTAINLEFSVAVNDLTGDDITITEGTGAVTVTGLSGSGTTWSLAVTATRAGTVTITINKQGIESIGKTVAIAYSAPPPTTYTAVPNSTTNTTAITLTFTESVTLIETDITITNGTGNVTPGTLTGSGTEWSIPITVTTAGTVTVKITKDGIESETKNVTVAKGSAPPTPITYTAEADGTPDTTAIILTFVESVTLIETDITITNGTGDVTVTPGGLTGSGTEWFIAITTVTTAGTVTVKITKDGIEDETKNVTVVKAGG